MNVDFGIIGIGRHGSRYVHHLQNDVFNARLTAAMRGTVKAERGPLKDHPDVNLYTDLDSFLGSGIDCVIVATPTDSHFHLAAATLKRDLHVLLEKPMCGTIEQCRDLMKIAESSNGTLTIAQTLRYYPVFRRLRERLTSKKNLKWFEMVQSLEPPRTSWLSEGRAMGGCVLNTGVHVFDTISYVLGEISSVSCKTQSIMNPFWEDLAYGDINLSDGIEGSFKISRITNSRSRYLRVDMDEGFLWADSLNDTLYEMKDGELHKEEVTGEKMTLIPLLEDMVEVVNRAIDPPVSGLQGMRAVETAMACYSSSDMNGNVVRLKSE
jgi:predicted dehydrogenase